MTPILLIIIQIKITKGIDDQLVGMFKNKEHELVEDIDRAINTKEGKGVYYQVYKITTEPEAKLLKLWNLDSAEKIRRIS